MYDVCGAEMGRAEVGVESWDVFTGTQVLVRLCSTRIICATIAFSRVIYCIYPVSAQSRRAGRGLRTRQRAA